MDDDDDALPEPITNDTDVDETLDDTAQGNSVTSDDTADGTGEIDAIGHAAGLVARDDKPFRGIEEVDRRDDHHWELDPASAEDLPRD
jgi:hypothetical protein